MSTTPTATQFAEYRGRGFNRVALTREVLADLDTPLSVYLKLARGRYSYLLESVHGGEKWGRYSIIGLPSATVLRAFGREVTVEQDGVVCERHRVEDPLEFVRAFKARIQTPEGQDLRFTGGLVGYIGYDAVRYIEPSLGDALRPDEVGGPDILLLLSDEVVVFDNLGGRLYVVVHADPEQDEAYVKALRRLDEIEARLYEPLAVAPGSESVEVREADFVSGFSRAAFEHAVEQIRSYIRAGDVMQVVLSQRLSIPFPYAPLDLYRSLRTLNPSPYMYFLDLGEYHIVGSSPEILARLEGERVTVRPIAGTRPRGRDEDEDRQFERDLLADEKERAEHLMLIDLGRNDVGRIAEIGSVVVTEKMGIERYSHVMHIVSQVEGRLRSGLDAIDVLKATLPAGTLSGAPKVRAMEIIDELEPVKRGLYGGAVGYLGWNSNMDLAIAIRTAVITAGRLYVQAGAGVVADSEPTREWAET
ncbi:MAG TPA: anthranilate synthase component I, partial [Acidiferrobacteraceae bacterium]|nr:anthranilate synthase component I [Acidiferrobacteraceae bacterium]